MWTVFKNIFLCWSCVQVVCHLTEELSNQWCHLWFFVCLQMLSQEKNPGVEFEYSLSKGTVRETSTGGEHYEWQLGEWSDCHADCGASFKTRKVSCANKGTKEIALDYLCGDALSKPPSNETCSGKPCKVSDVFNHFKICQADQLTYWYTSLIAEAKHRWTLLMLGWVNDWMRKEIRDRI